MLELLRSLTPEQWQAPTSCPGWSVKDIAAHILGDDLNNLSSGRDGFRSAWFDGPRWEDLVAFINERNEAWVDALRRVSLPVLVELLGFSGARVHAHFESLDPMAPGPNVAWAGSGSMPMWMHVAREYSERWLHQMQIREAVAGSGLLERRLFHPVLDTFVHALPVAYANVAAELGTHVLVEISGDAGGGWSLVKGAAGWELFEGMDNSATMTVRLDQDLAWRLWTKGVDPAAARAAVSFEGDRVLGEPLLGAVAIIA